MLQGPAQPSLGPTPAAVTAPLLSVKNIEVVYDDVILVLRGLSLDVPKGAIVALTTAISATVSAVAGIVVAVVNGVSSGLSAYGIKVFPAVILGGLDSIAGSVIGGIIIGLLENFAQFIDGEYLHWGNLFEVAPFYVLIIILMIKPYGLFGTKDIERI